MYGCTAADEGHRRAGGTGTIFQALMNPEEKPTH